MSEHKPQHEYGVRRRDDGRFEAFRWIPYSKKEPETVGRPRKYFMDARADAEHARRQ